MIQVILSFFLLSISTFQSKNEGEIHITIQESLNDVGMIQVLLFNNKEGFPSDPEKALKSISLPIKNKKAEIILKGIQPGSYAISVFHDDDKDGKIKTNALGIPIDKYGFSNNPTLLFGPPSFSRASFVVKDKPVKVEIKLH
ncbi:DUF2141 domain-containing protein [Algoriphagus sp.]|uniref:DUF2141 domain-containing protein n=1 Tax=Algoriphagus sp. TaxID=1872435 RepID=UPI0025F43284|nr:DUF2141 domain-containing protein [Algoriphagus sp.]